MSIRFECFGMTILKARAIDFDDLEGCKGDGCLILQLPNDGTINLFMPYESALEYANAMNSCNDREAAARSTPQDYIGTSEFMGGDDNDEAA